MPAQPGLTSVATPHSQTHINFKGAGAAGLLQLAESPIRWLLQRLPAAKPAAKQIAALAAAVQAPATCSAAALSCAWLMLRPFLPTKFLWQTVLIQAKQNIQGSWCQDDSWYEEGVKTGFMPPAMRGATTMATNALTSKQ